MMPAVQESIFYGIPSIDRRIDVECAISIFKMIGIYGGQSYFHMGISDISLARNLVTHKFRESKCDWFIMIDSDIIFTETDWRYLWEGTEDIVTAPYARKIPGKAPCLFGLGFTRVHRRVFEAIDALTNDVGAELAGRFYMENEIHVNYFPVGVTGDSRWLGEDRGFFTLCQMAGLQYRMENRCRLKHVGYFIYGYPDQDNGVTFWTPEPKPGECRIHGDNVAACDINCSQANQPIQVM
jgi:hypothetical protein